MCNNCDDGYHRPENGVLEAAQLAKLQQISTNGNGYATKRSRKLQKPPIKHLKCALMASDVCDQQRVKFVHYKRFIGVANQIKIHRVSEEAVA